MADKQAALSIVIRTVDKATAGIKAVNARLDAMTKPTRDFGKALSDLRDKSGIDSVAAGFRGVGSAVGDLLSKGAMIGGVIAGAAVTAVVALKSLVDQFATLGHIAQRAGVEVDFLAGLRYAGEEAGVSIEQVDEAITTLTQNLGQMKSGTGRAFKFITEHVSGVFAQQLIHTHSTAEAIGLIADALHKVPDAARRVALTQKLLGDPALVQVLMQGSAAIQEQMVAHNKLAGSQEEAVKGSLAVERSMVNMKAATDGVKAALVTGLSPALKVIVDDMTKLLVDHRADIAAWAKDFGEKLPGRIDELRKGIKAAIGDVMGFVDAIGGWRVAAGLVAAVIAGPLISAIVSLGIAIATTPVGWLLAAFALIGGAIALVITKWNTASVAWKVITDAIMFALTPFLALPLMIIRHWDGIKAFFGNLWDHVMNVFKSAWEVIKPIVDLVVDGANAVKNAANFLLPSVDEQRAGDIVTAASEGITLDTDSAVPVRQGPGAAARITVDFKNAPKGMRASADPSSTANVDLSVGHQMGAAW